ncbi:MAG: DUF1565 domain-containing protein [Nitrospiraceae bacterium]|nr:MAG: DUF1565 domain-containing protein [Nitrospiraceae bacterium]UCH45765.1 MAG: DUF1565 domain-containing protein [Nitrospiraceae bacterium]
MKHRRYIKIIGIISALFFLVSCGGGGGGGASVGSSLVTLKIGGTGPSAKAQTGQDTLFANLLSTFSPGDAEAGGVVVPLPDPCGIPPFVHMIRFIIEGDGMATITRDVLVNGRCEVIETFDVPNGPSRNFIALAFDVTNRQTHSGNTIENIPAPNNYVPIYMSIDDGCDLYVSIHDPYAWNTTDGPDNTCVNLSEPCLTITHALTQTPEGDETICVLPGVYRPAYEDPGESYPLIVDRSITLLCLNLIPGNGDVAANADNGVFLPAFPECILEGMRWDESYEPDGVVIKDNATINNFRIQHFPYPSGSQVFTGVNVVSGEPFVINNRITENVTGIGISGGNPHVRNNFISGNDQGIVIFPGIGADHDITNNTIGCNNLYDLFSNQTSGIINVPNNMWDHAPPEEFDRRDTTGCPAISDDICYDSNLGDVTVNTSPSIQSDFICNIFGPL